MLCTEAADRCQRSSTYFYFSLIIDGATEKVLQFKMPLKPVDNKKFGFIEQKCIFEDYIKVE
jgi:hypothetical protein